MIVPRTRLLLWISLIVLPFAAVGATMPGALVISALLIGGLFAAVLVDAFLARGQLAGIRVQLPEVVRLQKDRPGVLEVRIHNETLAPRLLRLGFAFPREIATETDDRTTLLPGERRGLAPRLDGHAEPARPVFPRARLSRSRFAAGILGGAGEPAGAGGSARLSESFRRAKECRRAFPAPRRSRRARPAPGGAGARF